LGQVTTPGPITGDVTSAAAAGPAKTPQAAPALALTHSHAPVPAPAAPAPARDLVLAAKNGELDALIGRAREQGQLHDALSTLRSRVICLVGQPGTGKTALVHGLAHTLGYEGALVPALCDRALFELPPDRSPSELGLPARAIAFYDSAPAPALMAALAREQSSTIVALTPAEARRICELEPQLGGQLVQIELGELSQADTQALAEARRSRYEAHHGVTYEAAAIACALRFAPRWVSERFLPDRALALLDVAGARARRMGRAKVGADDVVELVAESAGVPTERLLARDTERLLRMEDHLAEVVVGHRDALARIARVIQRGYAGFGAQRPVGSFLCLGPTGVGKTETAKAVAHFLMGSESAMVRLDMSEYAEAHQVSRLIGSPPGYVGHEDGGQLTEAVRKRPDTVVLLDEIDKAHRDVLPILLQVLDDGRLTDGRGRTVDFSHCVVFMTSNAGAAARTHVTMLAAARKHFPIELWNRIEEPLVFGPLGAAEVAEVARRLARSSSTRLERERNIRYDLDDRAIAYLLKHGGFDRELGARPMRAALGRLVEAPLAEAILAGRLHAGEAVQVGCVAGKLDFKKTS
jgi:ATP-dependent Clp protease ATP-binding subunit ClpC